MISHDSVNKWLQDYVAAWKSNDPAAIEALFSEEATYRFHPFDEDELRGRAAIVQSWLDVQDPPGSFDAAYKVVAVEGNTAVTNGRSLYFKADGKTVERQFDNIFVLRFDEEGRCTEFTEWYVAPRGQN